MTDPATRLNVETVVLSGRHLSNTPAQGCVAEFEDVLLDVLSAKLLAPTHHKVHPSSRWRRYLPPADMLRDLELHRAATDRMLIVIILRCPDLWLLRTLRRWRREFSLVCVYLFDCHAIAYPKVLQQIDRLFIPFPEFRTVYESHGVRTDVVPLAVDALRFGTAQDQRPVDVIGYGRQWTGTDDLLSQRFNATGSRRIYYHTPYRELQVSDHHTQRRLFWKMLCHSKVSLCYDVQSTACDRWRTSIVGQRWFESLAAGCAVVGHRPLCDQADELLDWDDATIELPGEPLKAVGAISELLEDGDRLAAVRRRNYWHMLGRHDWRYRIASMMEKLGVRPPTKLLQTSQRMIRASRRALRSCDEELAKPGALVKGV